MKADSTYIHSLESATPLTDMELKELETKLGFTYRQGIGEILYALVTCRPDVSFATIKLSQYLVSPSVIHYEALKDVYRCLKATQDEGIYYWRQELRMDLPVGPPPICRHDGNYVDSEVTS